MDALARQSLERQQNCIGKRLAHVMKHFEHFIKFALEVMRLNDEITQLQFKISPRTSGQTMLLLCLKWYFPWSEFKQTARTRNARTRNGSRAEREQRDNKNYKQQCFFFTSEKGNLEFQTEIEFSVLVI